MGSLDAYERVVTSIDTLIEALKKEIASLKKDIDDHIERHPQMKKDRALLETIPAVVWLIQPGHRRVAV